MDRESQKSFMQPFVTAAKRALLIFVFWFAVFFLAGLVYNEIVVSSGMKRLASNIPMVGGGENTDEELDEFARFQLEHHQLLSAATSAALGVVLARAALEVIEYAAGQSTADVISGRDIVYAAAEPAFAQDDEYDDASVSASEQYYAERQRRDKKHRRRQHHHNDAHPKEAKEERHRPSLPPLPSLPRRVE